MSEVERDPDIFPRRDEYAHRDPETGLPSDPPACLDPYFTFLEGTLREVKEKMIAAVTEATPAAEHFAKLDETPDGIATWIDEVVDEIFGDPIKAALSEINEYGFDSGPWKPEGAKRWRAARRQREAAAKGAAA